MQEDNLRCPISHEFMQDPVICNIKELGDQYFSRTFDRKSIKQLITNPELEHKLIPNQIMLKLIKDYLKDNPKGEQHKFTNAVLNNDISTVSKQLFLGIDIDSKFTYTQPNGNKLNLTAIQYAALTNNEILTTELLNYEPCLDLLASNNQTVFDIAKKNKNQRILQILKTYDAQSSDINLLDKIQNHSKIIKAIYNYLIKQKKSYNSRIKNLEQQVAEIVKNLKPTENKFYDSSSSNSSSSKNNLKQTMN